MTPMPSMDHEPSMEEKGPIDISESFNDENFEIEDEFSENEMKMKIRSFNLINGVSNKSNLHNVDYLSNAIMNELNKISE
jgi:hypothetical protein